ncbi:MAG: sulfurtransferase [Planctomycetes bacterium]|nr:sulfurtransferase [Planctomycetota bacterium]
MRSISCRDLADRLARGERPLLLDVREREEHAICHLPGSVLIPMSELPMRLAELDPDVETVVYCHHGIRSAHVIGHLQGHGFEQLVNLRGGIDAWSREVDPGVPRY